MTISLKMNVSSINNNNNTLVSSLGPVAHYDASEVVSGVGANMSGSLVIDQGDGYDLFGPGGTAPSLLPGNSTQGKIFNNNKVLNFADAGLLGNRGGGVGNPNMSNLFKGGGYVVCVLNHNTDQQFTDGAVFGIASASSEGWRVYLHAAGTLNFFHEHATNNGRWEAKSAVLGSASAHIVEIQYTLGVSGTSLGEPTIQLDGATAETLTETSAPGGSGGSLGYETIMGRIDRASDEGLNGNIAECMAFGYIPSISSRKSIQSYLASRYSVVAAGSGSAS